MSVLLRLCVHEEYHIGPDGFLKDKFKMIFPALLHILAFQVNSDIELFCIILGKNLDTVASFGPIVM